MSEAEGLVEEATGGTEESSWTSSFENRDLAGFAETKGFLSAEATVESYRNLEKMVGAPADRVLKLPDADGDWNPVFDKLGRPPSPDEYGLPVPEGDDGAFAKQASEWMHELGFSTKQAQGLAEKWNEKLASQSQEAAQNYEQELEISKGELSREWGVNQEKNEQIARSGAAALGLDVETINALESALGYAPLMRMMKSVGERMGESKMVTGESIVSNESAMSQIAALKADKNFAAAYARGDTDAIAKMDRLHKLAYPGMTTL